MWQKLLNPANLRTDRPSKSPGSSKRLAQPVQPRTKTQEEGNACDSAGVSVVFFRSGGGAGGSGDFEERGPVDRHDREIGYQDDGHQDGIRRPSQRKLGGGYGNRIKPAFASCAEGRTNGGWHGGHCGGKTRRDNEGSGKGGDSKGSGCGVTQR